MTSATHHTAVLCTCFKQILARALCIAYALIRILVLVCTPGVSFKGRQHHVREEIFTKEAEEEENREASSITIAPLPSMAKEGKMFSTLLEYDSVVHKRPRLNTSRAVVTDRESRGFSSSCTFSHFAGARQLDSTSLKWPLTTAGNGFMATRSLFAK